MADVEKKNKDMRIVKRDKSTQAFTPNKIISRIKTQAKGLKVDCDLLFQEVIPLINDGITTTEIDEIIAFKSADKIIQHPDYSLLGGRILISRQSKLIGKELKPVDLTYDFFAATTFLTKYSIKDDNKTPLELPSCMYERVSNYLHDGNNSYKEAYVLSCCQQIYCGCLNNMLNECPLCKSRDYINIKIETKDAMSCSLEDNKQNIDTKTKIDKMLEIIGDGKNKKILIFSNYNETFNIESGASRFNQNHRNIIQLINELNLQVEVLTSHLIDDFFFLMANNDRNMRIGND
jgi:ribonucleotide reductase alpha subunit